MKIHYTASLILLIPILLITSCRSSDFKLYLETSRPKGLEQSASVEFRGVKIGEVSSIAHLDSITIVCCSIDTSLTNIPVNAIYAIADKDILNTKFIDIRAKDALPPYFENGDTLTREVNPSLFSDSSDVKSLFHLVDSLAGKLKEVSKEYEKITQ